MDYETFIINGHIYLIEHEFDVETWHEITDEIHNAKEGKGGIFKKFKKDGGYVCFAWYGQPIIEFFPKEKA